ncbi:hypothetical protein [Paraburkholderia sp. EG304]|uniref:hypothetical protein n=1 Tax=Paraburkholderia sp. EG304 TaxID=3237015 RepID=UPI00397BCB7F
MNVESIVGPLSRSSRAWIDLDGCGSLYLRLTSRGIDGLPRTVIDIANVEVLSAYRLRGLFARSVQVVEEAARYLGRDGVFVELVLNPIVRDALARRGYSIVPATRGAIICDAYRIFEPVDHEPLVRRYEHAD